MLGVPNQTVKKSYLNRKQSSITNNDSRIFLVAKSKSGLQYFSPLIISWTGCKEQNPAVLCFNIASCIKDVGRNLSSQVEFMHPPTQSNPNAENSVRHKRL